MTRRIAPLPHRHVLTLPARPASVRTARETTQQLLAEWGISPHHPAVDPALLILSELVTNSVRHAASHSPHVTVSYAAGYDTLVFAVHDRHPYQPTLRTTPTGTTAGAATGGVTTGLATVAELTSSLAGSAVVHQDGDGGGKSICITLPL
ncbi:ATP-binding protein [Streptomyces sp. NPDC127033]|uniref:ATP-binding protein n=1 Tax=Streptomyces sp. NPDC127033 TaxID=3347110 RepID=UPI00364C75DD